MAADHYLYISTPNTNNVNFKIIEIGGTIITGVASNNAPFVYSIGTGNTSQLFTAKNNTGIVKNKGYIIEAEALVYVSVRGNSAFSTQSNSYNHAGGLVSKGNSALGKTFRLGAMLNPNVDNSLLNFASILSTENNTKVTISNIPVGTIFSNGTTYTVPIVVTLNKNESFVMALENYATNNIPSNSSKIIGALVESDKSVVVNSGSFGGSNSTSTTGRDVGYDQIVPLEKTGKEYIFVKGIGTDDLERVLLISNSPNTLIYLNGSTTLFATLAKAGDYVAIDGSQFSNGNLYVTTSDNVFAYQSIGGSASPANQNLFFVPPLNCTTPNSVDNIPFIESIGNMMFNGGLNIVTEKGAVVKINNNAITATAIDITGNPDFVRYTINNLSGNIAVKSTKQVYVSYFGTNGAATYGGYYSGFDLKPEIISDKITISNSACIPNVVLKISTLSSYNTFQWYFNDVAIDPLQHPDAITNTYTPDTPGYYQVRGAISGCPSNGFIFSDKIPVSSCPTNVDSDLANDNIDLDNDNDGITNCTESYGNQNINISSSASGAISVGSYSNTFTGAITGTGGTFTGNADGSFVSEIPAGITNSLTYTMSFTSPMSAVIEYVSTANSSNLLNPDAEYIVNSDINKTITVLNPNNQLLIDTNYDGIYETGITEYSSFEIRFRLNGTLPLAAGTGTFQFLTYLTNSISFTHKNLSDTNPNKVSLKFFTPCVPKHSDGDGIPDQLDTDSDNDGIPDTIEAQGNVSVAMSNTDTNKNGLDNAFEPGFTPVDTDLDGVPDYLDLDSDNDGILDSVETATDFDGDGIKNYRDLDSDGDLCLDVIEAGFLDPDNDGLLGNSPVNLDVNGKVTSALGYTIPNTNYLLTAPIAISVQPQAMPTCHLQNTTIMLTDNADSYQWQISTNGVNWNNISNDLTYSGGTTNKLVITSVKNSMNGYKYRVQLNKTGNSCGLVSNETALTVYPSPIINSPIVLIQCDDDIDGLTIFNLTQKNSFISSDATHTFSYFENSSDALIGSGPSKISSPTAYANTTPFNQTVWVRVENSYGCFSVAQIDLKISATSIPNTFQKTFETCDDYIDSLNDDKDGIATFDLSSVATDINNILPVGNYTINYYQNQADALSQLNGINDITNYRNSSPNSQQIWIRVDSTLDNACFGIGPYIKLIVNPKPKIDTNEDHSQDQLVCSNVPTFFVTLSAGIQDGSPATDYSYIWSKDRVVLPYTTPTIIVNAEGDYTVEVSTLFGCSSTRNIKVTASDIATITTIAIVDFTDINSVTINVTGKGLYEYSLDDPSGPYQTSNVFNNVPSGIHDVFINDINGCGTVSKTISVIGVPKYFTPNGDGSNDYWNVKGINANFNTNSIIYIFDRYGKLLKQLIPTSQGWDGTFNGAPLPSDDYWYTINLEDGREAKGHFSLKR